jgi:hypothetical protein
MNRLITTNTTEPSETNEGSENEPDAWQGFTGTPLNRFGGSLLRTTVSQAIISDETGCPETDECTYETDEIEEAEEAEETQETEELEEKEELARLSPKLSMAIDGAISKCRVSRNRDVNRPLFMLAHKLRSIEEKLNARFSMDVVADILHRWKGQNHDHLEDDHDYLAEFLDKLSLVRYPRGRALLRAVEIAEGRVPPRKTRRLSSGVQLLASLCGVLQYQAGEKPFFLDGRSAARALGKPHRTVASWLRALRHLGVIGLISQGKRGMASRYEYLVRRGE